MDIDEAYYGEVRPLNLTPQTSSPFVRRFNQFNSGDFNPSRSKRRKTFSGGNDTYGVHAESKYNRDKSLPDVLDYSDPFSVPNLMEELGRGVYGSVTKDVEDLRSRWKQLLNPLLPFCSSLSSRRLDFSPQTPKSGLHTHDLLNGQGTEVSSREVIDLDGDCDVIDSPAVEESKPVLKSSGHVEMPKVDSDLQNHNDRQIVILDSDEEENAEQSGTKQGSRCSPENIRFEVPQTPEQRNHNILDLDRGKSRSLLTHVDTTSHEVYDDQHHIVPCNALDVNWKASLHYQGVVLKKPVDETPVKDHAVSGTEEASRCSLEDTKFEAPQRTQEQNHDNLDLDRGKSTSLLTHLDTTSHKVYDDQHHIVPCNALDANWKASLHYQGVVLKKPIDENPVKDHAVLAIDGGKSKVVKQEEKTLNAETQSEKDKGVYVGVQDDTVKSNDSQYDSDDGLGDIWREMTVALECNKDAAVELMEQNEDEQGEECDHSFLLKDDLGYVCRVCGVIRKSIETIFDYQWVKGSKTSRMYNSEHRSMKEKDEDDVVPFSGPSGSHHLAVVEMSVHPRYMKLMKPHQLEGFNFLVRNLISDDPGGCILAHAPGSGKTFMIISFIQSFLTKFPDARPLVVLPKGILGTWKKEFIKWQVEEIPLYDFYSSKADSRADQLVVLKEWVEQKGVLFLGYKQFANIVCKNESNVAAACQDILLRVPTILICDEGHTPRNQDTDILLSLKKVHTPRKVVLSGTLYQNHVQEVFNILNLVRPNFLKSETSRTIRRRVMSRGEIGRKQHKAGADAAFYEVVEDTLQNDENSKRKVAIIQDLREMTKNVLHYYKGDFLEELPGLVDLTVLLNLSPKQKQIVNELRKMEKFKRTSIGTAVYLHPLLKEFSEEGEKSCNNTTTTKPKLEKACNVNEAKMNDLIDKMDIKDGIKAKFFLNILGLCESSGEKLLVFSQYLIPLKFLERLVVKRKGWSPGKEIFMINGDTSPEDRELSMDLFNNSSDAKVFFGSIKACGEGISLVGASRILILDVHLNPSVTRQAIGRAFRPGQVRKVYVYRLVAADSPEEESHSTSCRKDLVSKMWFEWSEYCGYSKFEMETINLDDSDDTFWDSRLLREDVNEVKKR